MKKNKSIMTLGSLVVSSVLAAQSAGLPGYELREVNISMGFQKTKGGPFHLLTNMGEVAVGHSSDVTLDYQLSTGALLPNVDLIYLAEFE